MFLGANEFARRDIDGVQTRPEARLSWSLDDLSTSDNHRLRVRFSCGTRVADASADRRMFAQVMLGARSSVTIDQLTEHFGSALRAAALDSASKHPAIDWAEHRIDQVMIDALLEAAKRVSFACGLEILQPYQLEVTSPSLELSKLEAVARARAEERAAGQVESFKRAADLLHQFKELRAAAPDLPAGALLERMSDSDRGATLQTLLLASAQQATALLWAVAGQNLLKIDPRAPGGAKIELIHLPETLGPLRSVQPADMNGQRMLLIGARSGVMLVDPAAPDKCTIYSADVGESQLGFNSAAATRDRIWACHGEAGVIAWPINAPENPQLIWRPIPTIVSQTVQSPMMATAGSPSLMGSRARLIGPRNLRAIDETRVIYSAGPDIFWSDGTDRVPIDLASSASDVIAIVPDESQLLFVREDGTVEVLDRGTRQITSRQRRGSGRICSAGALPWFGGARLLLASDGSGAIDCVGMDDSIVSRFASRYISPRAISATNDLVAAVSADRQRVILWPSHDGREPCAEIHVASIARHRVADIEFSSLSFTGREPG